MVMVVLVLAGCQCLLGERVVLNVLIVVMIMVLVMVGNDDHVKSGSDILGSWLFLVKLL